MHVMINSTNVELPPIVASLLMDILTQTAQGNTISLIASGTEVTTQQAADLLNVSRRFLVELVENFWMRARFILP